MSDPSVPPPKENPEGSVWWYDDPKIKGVLTTLLTTLITIALGRWFKIATDPAMTTDLSTWIASLVLPAIAGSIVVVRAIRRRVKAGKDPNNPAKPIAGPALIGKLLGG